MKLWGGRFSKNTDEEVNDFNSSLSFDARLYKYDIRGSIAHTKMLNKIGVLSDTETKSIITGLTEIMNGITAGDIYLDPAAEDIHMNVETILTKKIGSLGGKLHTARSRNDQVALDTRMYLRDECIEIQKMIKRLLKLFLDLSEQHLDTIMPGFTHMQPAQPVTLAHHMMAYFEMFKRDILRLSDCYSRINIMPLGACALAGTGFPIDREYVAQLLGFDSLTQNSMDAVSDRDYIIEFNSALSILMMHLSRFCEELIIWNTSQFSFAEPDDAFSTGSSIMPQKKNPDVAELIRGKTSRVYGNLFNLLSMMKSLPLAYNKDMQEDKPAIFDSIDTVKLCLQVFSGMISTISFNKEQMKKSAGMGYTNATDLADYLTIKGIPFRMAHEITGKIVSYCISKKVSLDELDYQKYLEFSTLIDKDIFEYIFLENCVSRRRTVGGPSPHAVKSHIKTAHEFIKEFKVNSY